MVTQLDFETDLTFTADEMMTIVASRELSDGNVVFVGIGIPSTAANLARLTHAPKVVLVYESGTIGTKPTRPPLSIGDGELAETADAVVSVPEIFAYWLQAGRIDIGFLGAAQLDRWGNLNTTVVGDYDNPTVRLPGAGGAPEIAFNAHKTMVVLRQNPRAFVDHLDFITSVGHYEGHDSRSALGAAGGGPSIVITDIGVLRPDALTSELVLVSLHPGRTIDEAVSGTGWDLRIADDLATTAPPTAAELAALRELSGS
ncbi:MAG: CoA-transferase [Actinomycetes bacterium]